MRKFDLELVPRGGPYGNLVKGINSIRKHAPEVSLGWVLGEIGLGALKVLTLRINGRDVGFLLYSVVDRGDPVFYLFGLYADHRAQKGWKRAAVAELKKLAWRLGCHDENGKLLIRTQSTRKAWRGLAAVHEFEEHAVEYRWKGAA